MSQLFGKSKGTISEHIKNVISQENLKPNYDTKTENTFPIFQVLVSLIIFGISAAIGLIHDRPTAESAHRRRKDRLVSDLTWR